VSAQDASGEVLRLIELGHAVEDQGNAAMALAHYEAAIAIAPDSPRGHLNAGNALKKLNRRAEAGDAFRRALEVDPGYAAAAFNLGLLLAEADDRDAAKQALQQALRLQPDVLWKVLDAESYLLFRLALVGELEPPEIAREHFRVGADISRAAGRIFHAWANTPLPDRPLRIGYVSGDFTMHPVALFLKPILQRHRRNGFAAYCYSNAAAADPMTVELHRLANEWRDVSSMDDDDFVRLVREDAIDILVDLSGHSERNRLGVFARHPAPVQITWLGYLGTTGLTAMDYRLCDWHTDPAGETEALHTERLERMPYSQWCYVPWLDVEASPPSDARPPSEIVFGSFNQSQKVSKQSLDLWAPILVALPDARLVIHDVRDHRIGTALLDRLEERGVERHRVSLRGRLGLLEYYKALSNVDIALDTHPYNGATTTFDALWMGTPLVALRGDRGISRSSYSILKTLALPELITRTTQEFLETNVRLAGDPTRRTALRLSLRNWLSASPLMDQKRFVDDLESIYRRVWSAWCDVAGHKPG